MAIASISFEDTESSGMAAVSGAGIWYKPNLFQLYVWRKEIRARFYYIVGYIPFAAVSLAISLKVSNRKYFRLKEWEGGRIKYRLVLKYQTVICKF